MEEYARAAADRGLQAIAITDHAPALPDGAHLYHFQNMVVLPRKMNGVIILRGVECSFLNSDADLDLDDKLLSSLDIVIASLHRPVYSPKDENEHTEVLARACENPNIDILGHIGREKTEFDIELVVKKAKANGKLIEINSSSLTGKRAAKRCLQVAKMCKEHSVPIALTSDSHISSNVGNVDLSIQLLKKINFDERLVVNSTFENLKSYFGGRKNVFRG
ncbi:MAG: PHP domain-containing protein [Firmicutes bacterium]|nr:PHP domain-containing protein [Bacillota bacterium]